MGIILDLYTRQIATREVLRQLGATDEQIETALRKAHSRVGDHPALRGIRSQPDSSSLSVAENTLRKMQ